MSTNLFTIGHSTHEPEAFGELLHRHGVELLVDVRRHPGSRRVPWTNPGLLSNIDSLASSALQRLAVAHVYDLLAFILAGPNDGAVRVRNTRGLSATVVGMSLSPPASPAESKWKASPA